MPKTRRERCPQCGFLDVIKWGKQSGHQRYKCKNCGTIFGNITSKKTLSELCKVVSILQK